jgi:hypothetical protein
MSPGDADSYSETVTQTQGADVRISANAYLPIKKLQSSTVHTEKFPEECEECEHPSCGFTDPDGDPCQLFSTRTTTTVISGTETYSASCGNGNFYSVSGGASVSATITETATCGEATVTNKTGSSSASLTAIDCYSGFVHVDSSCESTLTNDGWSNNGPCIAGESETTVSYSNPIDRCCDGYAPVGPYCQCEYIGG